MLYFLLFFFAWDCSYGLGMSADMLIQGKCIITGSGMEWYSFYKGAKNGMYLSTKKLPFITVSYQILSTYQLILHQKANIIQYCYFHAIVY